MSQIFVLKLNSEGYQVDMIVLCFTSQHFSVDETSNQDSLFFKNMIS